jgi:hypothetical protein
VQGITCNGEQHNSGLQTLRKTHRVLARNLSPLIGSSRGSPNPPLVAQYFNSAPPKIFTSSSSSLLVSTYPDSSNHSVQ